MEYLLDAELFDRYYNCSFYDYNSIPRQARQHLIAGACLLVLYVVFEALYLPCLGVFGQSQNRRMSCYKLMLAMGVFSICSIHSSCLIIGLYAVRGDVFCDRPVFNYWIGMASFAGYTTESILNVILALDRCVEMWDSQVAATLFGGKRVNIWVCAALIYGLTLGFWTIPPLPNGILVGFFWNPHIPYVMDPEGWYHPQFFAMHNFIIGLGIPSIYGTFYFLMRRKMSIVADKQHAVEMRKSKMNMFTQVLMISVLNMSFAFLYIYMQYFPVQAWMAMFASYAWACSQGFIPIIYITLNKSVRKSVKANFLNPALSYMNVSRIKVTVTVMPATATAIARGSTQQQATGVRSSHASATAVGK